MRVLGLLALVAAIAAAIMYAEGWLIFQPRPDSTTIEVKTEAIKREAADAAERGRELWRDTKENLEPRREPVENEDAYDTTPSTTR